MSWRVKLYTTAHALQPSPLLELVSEQDRVHAWWLLHRGEELELEPGQRHGKPEVEFYLPLLGLEPQLR